MNTLLLDPTTWDLVLDTSGNVALAENPYAAAQDAASAIKTFSGEVYYDTTLGIPYFQSVLGKFPPISLFRSWAVREAMRVPDVVSAQCYFTSFSDRTLSGQVQIETSNGEAAAAGF